MMKHILLTLIAALFLCFAHAGEKPEFLIVPGSSLCRSSQVLPEAVTAAEKQLILKKKQYRQGLSDYLSVMNAEIRALKLQISLLCSGGEEKKRLLQQLRHVDAERMKQVEARYRSGGISEREYRADVFRYAWERLSWENAPEHAATAVCAAEALEVAVQDSLHLGQADRAEYLIAAITCGETKLRQNRSAADLQQQAAAVQKLYDELAALYSARAKQALCSPVMAAEAESAARCFALECARYVNRDEESARHDAASIMELQKKAGENP